MRTEVAAILFTLAAVLICIEVCAGATYSFRLIHRFSDEARSVWAAKGRQGPWPERDSVERARLLLSSDFKHQRLRLGSQKQLLVPSEGSQTFDYGNDWSWLHYAWIDIGTPNVSFLVALDTGSDLLWVPCDCVQCAPLSSSYYTVLDRDLNEYSPARSSTSKQLPCSHQLCDLGPDCKSPKEHCPYMVDYLSENTSSSGFLFEDQLHLILSGEHSHQDSALAPIIIGCGSKQSGSYLDGAAPDGVLGLGPGKISVPSLLANSGLVPHSFSLCFDKSHSGRIFFGDQGPGNQRFTPFLPLEGNYNKYIVEVEHYCVESSCLKQSGFRAQVDSGSSFTLLPYETYKKVVNKFTRFTKYSQYEAHSFCQPEFCDSESHVSYSQLSENFMTGYRMVFDWEKLKLGWSASNCNDLDDNDKVPVTPTPSGLSASPLPTNEQQRTPNGHAVAPALAGRAPPRPSAASPCTIHCQHCTLILLMLLQSFVWLCYLV
nr:aspartic proteinase-like protein 1 isoform X1 [Ipomoea trifida]